MENNKEKELIFKRGTIEGFYEDMIQHNKNTVTTLYREIRKYFSIDDLISIFGKDIIKYIPFISSKDLIKYLMDDISILKSIPYTSDTESAFIYGISIDVSNLKYINHINKNILIMLTSNFPNNIDIAKYIVKLLSDKFGKLDSSIIRISDSSMTIIMYGLICFYDISLLNIEDKDILDKYLKLFY